MKKIITNIAVKNTGQGAGEEVVMLFSTDEIALITMEGKRLRRFSKISP